MHHDEVPVGRRDDVITRRKALTAVGLGFLSQGKMFSQEQSRGRPSLSFLFRNHETAPAQDTPTPASWDSSGITAAWLGHATVLLNFFGTHIITDPVFSKKIGIDILGIATIGPQRLVAPALSFEQLPAIDLILLSHAHMDHMDFPSLRRFDKRIPVVMASNTSDLLISRGWSSVRELDWGQRATVAGIDIEALRVNHFGWRYPWEADRAKGDRNGRSFNGYLLTKNGRSVVFGGDTAYQEYFKSLAERNIQIECAILSIGAYNPWIRVHANPEQAVEMANHMSAKTIFPIHWGTFMMGIEPPGEPIERLKNALVHHSPSLAVERIGQTWTLPG